MKWLRSILEIFTPKKCAVCGHLAAQHDEKWARCTVIDISAKPFPPWTMESIMAGQHRPCRCTWDGKTEQKKTCTQ